MDKTQGAFVTALYYMANRSIGIGRNSTSSAGARRLRKTLRRCPAGAKKIAQRIASWTWDVTHERALSPADLFGGKAPVGALIGLLEQIR